MGYRVVVGGVQVECDSIDEALALAQRAGGQVGGEQKGKPAPLSPLALGNSRWTEARITDFLGHMKGNQRKLIDELLDHPEGRTDEQLLTALGVRGGKALAGVFTGLWKNAKKVGADPNDVYAKQQINIADRKGFEYMLSESFRRGAEKVRPTLSKR